MENKIFTEENTRLRQVIAYIDYLLATQLPQEESMRQEIIEQRRRIWDDYSRRPDDVELMQANQALELDTERYFRVRDALYTLQKVRSSPYFARIDFRRDGEEASEPIYIGSHSLIDAETYRVLICDWRADVASLFYDATLGQASYRSEDGDVSGEITLRRQIRVEDGELKYAFDTGLNITDPVLMEELGKSSDAKLKTIVSTIQKEQNRVIRDLDADLLIVRGSAGSGKTSVALHRLAFLLYRCRGSLTPQNVVIFSPSEIFSAYIADVLPELGEESAIRTDFYHYFCGYDAGYRFCDKSEQTEALLASDSDFLREMIVRKGAAHTANELKEFFDARYAEFTVRDDLRGFGETLATKEELSQWFLHDYAAYKTYVRAQKITSRAVGNAEEHRDAIVRSFLEEATMHGVVSLDEEERKQEAEAMWASGVREIGERVSELLLIAEEELYLDFLSARYPEYYAHTKALLSEKVVAYEDLFPLAWLRFLSGKTGADQTVRQVVADEAQDAPEIVFMLLSRIFPKARFTILGDPDQQIGGRPVAMEKIADCFTQKRSTVFYTLDKSYRSTREINAFAARFRRGGEDLVVYERGGEEPSVQSAGEPVEQISRILDEYRRRGHRTNLILCRTQAECDRLYETIFRSVPVVLLRSFDSFTAGTTAILPVYLSKGLEADGVIVYGVSDQWNTPEDKALLYVAATRAMHSLTVIKSSEKCTLLDH